MNNEREKKGHTLWFLLLCLALVALAAVFLRRFGKENMFANIDSNQARLDLIAALGHSVEETPCEVLEVTIPREFDSVYERYNDLQKPLGLDLSAHKGKTVRRYTYVVTDHPYEGTVYLNLLVCSDEVIGGDICSADVTGFVESLRAED